MTKLAQDAIVLAVDIRADLEEYGIQANYLINANYLKTLFHTRMQITNRKAMCKSNLQG